MSIWSRMTNRWRREEVSAAIDEELAAHLAMAEEESVRSGLSPEEAHRAARVRFGNVDRMREQAHRADVALPFDGWRTALRATVRGLRRSPGFTATVVLTLALGIGATTALFTLVYDVMLKPLPFPEPGRLVVIQEKVKEFSNLGQQWPVSANHFADWERNNRSFSAMSAMELYSMPLGAEGRPTQVEVLSATSGLFPVLGVAPRLGRPFTREETQPGHEHVVVLTDGLWREQFGGDRAILGKTIRLNGYAYTVIGVMGRDFHMPPTSTIASSTRSNQPLSAIIPLAFTQDQLGEQMGDLNYFALGRLRPGVSVASATGDLDALQSAISASLPAEAKATLSIALTPLQQELIGTSREPLLLLLAAVVGLLLVGCVNIANLLLARSVGRRQQMALVCALGAGRMAMLRMAFRETAVLALAGGALGIGLAAALVPWMQRFLPPMLNFRGPLHLDWTGAGCALLLALAAMALAGGIPAWRASSTAPQEVLHSESRLASESRSSRRVRRTLVAVEAAMSIGLLLVTGLLAASVNRLLHVDLGFTPARTMTAMLELPAKQYTDTAVRAAFFRELLAKLQALPGVEQAAITSVLPLTGDSWQDMAQLPGDTRPITAVPIESFRWVSPEYFKAIGLPMAEGHSFTQADWGRRVALVSEKTAKTLWGSSDPLGRQFFRGGTPEELYTVVGVVENARTISLAKPDPMMIYTAYWNRTDMAVGLVLRTKQEPATVADSVRKTIWSIDPGIPVPAMRTLGGLVTDSVADQRFERDLLVLFAASALLLAALGVYGVVSYSVEQRQREIGLRLALGAPRASVYAIVLRDGLPPVALGVAAGILLVYALGDVLRALLYGVTVYNPLVTLGAAALLLALAVASCLLPARRAARVEPSEALRAE